MFLYIPDNPGTARYLTRRQQKVAKSRLRKDFAGYEAGKGGLKWEEIRKSLVDPKSYLTAVRSARGKDLICTDERPQAMFFCSNVAFSSLPVFLPTIIKEYVNALYFPLHVLTYKDGLFRSDFASSLHATLPCCFPYCPSDSILFRSLPHSQRLRRLPCPSRFLRLRNDGNHGLCGG